MRRYTLISAAVAVLLLGACSKDENKQADTQEQTAADSAGEGTATSDAKQPDFWPLVAPLLAGSYGGECQRMPQMEKMAGAAIALSVDGKVSAPGNNVDMRKASSINLTRELRDGVIRTSALLSNRENGEVLLSMLGEGSGLSTVSIAAAGNQVMCSKSAPLTKLAEQPLYKTVAKIMEAPAQNIKCLDINTMASKETDFKVVNGVATLGGVPFDINKAKLETLILGENASDFSYAFTLPDERTLQLMYDGEGKLKAIQGRNATQSTHACGR